MKSPGPTPSRFRPWRGNLAPYEYPMTPDGIPASVTVGGMNSADYWIVVYNISDPE